MQFCETKNEIRQILLVAPNEDSSFSFHTYLSGLGFSVTMVDNGMKGLLAFKEGRYQLCIIDLEMRYRDGYTLAREIKKRRKEIPLLFLSSKEIQEEVLMELNVGRKDFLVRPLEQERLLKKIARLEKEGNISFQNEIHIFKFGNFRFDCQGRKISSKGDTFKLTDMETRILHFIVQHFNTVLSKKQLAEAVWGRADSKTGKRIEKHLAKLRKYLVEDEDVQIRTIYGKGIKLEVRDREEQSTFCYNPPQLKDYFLR